MAAAKFSFNTRRIPSEAMVSLLTGKVSPSVGDLVLARITTIGQHTRLQTQEGRRARLYKGDEVVVCYGNRYAAKQFEAIVPRSLKRCNLVASGGLAATVTSSHTRMKKATEIEPLGLIGDSGGRPINLADWSLPFRPANCDAPNLVIAVAGTEMDAGKTTTVAHIIKGLHRAGFGVAAAKVTGTGACGDYLEMCDAGATTVYDFVDAGFPSTHRISMEDLERIFSSLIGNLQAAKPDAIVIEVADGILQKETSAVMCLPLFKNIVNSVVISSGDTMGAKAAVEWLERFSLPATAISGRVTESRVGVQATEEATGLPVLNIRSLANPEKIGNLVPKICTPALRVLGDRF